MFDMKKMKIVVLTTACILACSSIIIAISGKEIFKSKDDSALDFDATWTKDKTLIASLQDSPVNLPLNELKEQSYSKFISAVHTQSFDDFDDSVKKYMSSKISTLYLFNKSFPIEHIQIIDNENICVIYKLKKEDSSLVYAYVVFRKQTQDFDVSDGVEERGTYEQWVNYGEYYLVSKSNKFDDYKHIKTGEKLSEKDSLELAIDLKLSGLIITKRVISLFEDGVFVITMERNKNEDDILSNYTIVQTDFYTHASKDTGGYKFAILRDTFFPTLP